MVDVVVCEFGSVTHVGTLNPADRAAYSFEGDGLSISVHPDDWETIARLTGTRWKITAPSGPLRLLDAHATDTEQVMVWAAQQGWVTAAPVYSVAYDDDEDGQERRMVLLDRAEADLEADDRETVVDVQTGWVATAAHPCQRASVHAAPNPVDETVVEWVRATRPDLHGVWWEDTYDPWALSCPRGALTVPLGALTVTTAR